jgi:hypothetical protein
VSILFASRPQGRREPLCVGEEARISRIRSRNRYDGMVERVQQLGVDPGKGSTAGEGNFIFYLSPGDRMDDYHFPSILPHYQVMKFLSLRFAKIVFPENFVDARQMRFFEEDGKRYAAMYSDFIPDSSGVIARRREAMLRFYEVDDALRQSIRESLDSAERRINPKLIQDMEMISKTGIGIPHPEANHHLAGSKNVFFEVEGIDISKAIQAGRGGKGNDYLALMYAVFLKLASRNLASESADQAGAVSFCKTPLAEVYGIIRQIMLDEKSTDALLRSWVGAVKFGTEHWGFCGASAARRNGAPLNPVAPLPCKVSSDVFGMLEGSTGRSHPNPDPRK